MKPVKIRWVDSASFTDGAWHDHGELTELEPMTIETVGFLYRETKKMVTVVSSLGSDSGHGEISIPKFAIKKMRVLK